MKLSKIYSMGAVALGATAALSLASCNDDCPDYWGKYYGEFTPKQAYIWVDASANAPYLANSKENIAKYIGQAKDCGFTDIVVDVRGTDGDVLFKTDLVDPATTYYAWDGTPTERTADWDYLQAFIDAGHAAGVRVHAAMNTMVGGNIPRGTSGKGMLFRDPSKRDWCNVINTPNGFVNQLDLTESGETTKFLNPHHPEVKDFIVGLVGDLAKYTDLDGIVLDRGRFKDMTSDFSDIARTKFEEFVGERVANWPGDILPVGATTVPAGVKKEDFPKYYQQWWEFRAKAMHDIVAAASEKAHEVHPGIQFSCYVGAWYGSYYQSGVNWASPKYDPANDTWASTSYCTTGYADHIDMLILGCYAKPDKVFGSTEWTVQGFASNGYAKVMGACQVIGGPDIGNNWPTAAHDYVFADSDKDKQYYLDQAANTVPACMGVTDGYFMFDICHLQSSPEYWGALAAGFRKYLDSDDDYGRDNQK